MDNLVELFSYCVITHDGRAVAGDLHWDDVVDLLELLDVQDVEMVADEGQVTVVTLPPLHRSDMQIAEMWGKVRQMARAYKAAEPTAPILSHETRADLHLLEPKARVFAFRRPDDPTAA